MKDKKNIDQLFKDRFQGMETTPPPAVWEGIEKQLGAKKKDRKVIPLWWKAAGIAAILLLSLLVGRQFISGTSEPLQTPKVVEQTTPTMEQQDSQTIISNPEENSDNNIVVQKTDDINASEGKTNSEKKATQIIPTLNESSNVKEQISPNTKEAVAQQNSKRTTHSNKLSDKETRPFPESKNQVNKVVAATQERNNGENTTIPLDNDTQNKQSIKNTLPKENSVEAVALENKEDHSTDPSTQQNKIIEENKPSIFDAIKEQEDAVAEVETNQKRWQVMPTLAPVYYNSLGEGSSIDPSFADNSKSGDVNLSYGVQVSYAITERLNIRSGIANVNLSYSTSDLELATGDVNAALQSINYGQSGIVTTAVDRGAIAQAAPGTPFANLTRKATAGEVLLTQELSYIEIPTELTYTIVDSKLSLNVIGGFSTLFLGNNSVSVSATDFESELGEANNLNDLSFTTNVGLGMQYNFSKRFSLNLEPVFKYQLNPYSTSNVSFQPYYMGVYSGLQFRF